MLTHNDTVDFNYLKKNSLEDKKEAESKKSKVTKIILSFYLLVYFHGNAVLILHIILALRKSLKARKSDNNI